MASERICIRLPREYHTALRAAAEAGGYQSPCQLARCVLVQFLRLRGHAQAEGCYTDWAEEMLADHLDPRNRAAINRRL